MKKVRLRQCSFEKPTQFTMLIKVLEPLSANIHISLIRASMLLAFTGYGDFKKGDVLTHESNER
jgi:hypothetical protein